MKREDFDLSVTMSGKEQYLHRESGEKRKQLLRDVMSGKISQQQFQQEQKKMRGGKYLKLIYTKYEMEKAIQEALCKR